MHDNREQPAPPRASRAGNERSTPVVRDDGTRARQRLMMLGPEQLDDIDLLALILGGAKATERTHVLLQGSGGLFGLAAPNPHQLARICGVGTVRAAKIAAALELGRRVAALAIPHGRTIERLDDVAFLRASIGTASQEVFMVLGLDSRSRLRLLRTVAMGSLTSVYVHPREVFRPAVHAGICGVLLAHNHPSGEAEPSDADLVVMHRLAEVGRLLGIPVLDYLIATRSVVVSIMEHGLLSMNE